MGNIMVNGIHPEKCNVLTITKKRNKKRNKLGPMTDPWGTPNSTGILSDDSPSITTD
jgi:hypothetical protein